MAHAEERTKGVYGVGYAGWRAAADVLGWKREEIDHAQRGFAAWLIAYAVKVVADVKEDVNVNKFWQAVIDAYKVGVFGHNLAERQVYFKALGERAPGGHPPMAPNQHMGGLDGALREDWKKWRLYVNYGAVIGKLTEHLRKQNQTMPLSPKDLRDQMQQHPYWLGEDLKQRFGSGASPSKCWGVDVDLHPMGYQLQTDEAVAAALDARTLEEEWVDPRLGELYLIVRGVERKPEAAP